MKLNLFGLSLLPVVLSYFASSLSVAALPVIQINSRSLTTCHLPAGANTRILCLEASSTVLSKRAGILERLGLKKPLTPQQIAEKKRKLEYRHQVKMDKLRDKHRSKIAKLEMGGKHQVDAKYTGIGGDAKHRALALKTARENWKSDKQMQMFRHASVTATRENSPKGERTHVITKYHNGDESASGHSATTHSFVYHDDRH